MFFKVSKTNFKLELDFKMSSYKQTSRVSMVVTTFGPVALETGVGED